MSIAVGLAVAGCGRPVATESGKPLVAVSVQPHAWLVEQIAGGRVEVLLMIQPGEIAELYQPTDAQISRLARAAAYFRTGMPLERSRGLAGLTAGGRLRAVDLRDGLPLRRMDRHTHDRGHEAEPDLEVPHGDRRAAVPGGDRESSPADDSYRGADPHIWLSPRLLKRQAAAVAETLSEIDPDGASRYRENLASLVKRMDVVDGVIRQTLRPIAGKAFFVFHPAWGYFADDYGLRQIAVEAEGKEPSDRELTELQQRAKETGIKVVFVQPQFAGRAAQGVARAIGARVESLDDLPADLDEALLRTARALAKSYEP